MKLRSLPGPPWIYTIITVCVVLYLTLTPQPLPDNDIEWFEGADKVVHALMFGAVVVVWGFDYLRRVGRVPTAAALAAAALATMALGGVIEVLQANVIAGRSGDMQDFLADAAGAAFGALVAPSVLKKIQ